MTRRDLLRLPLAAVPGPRAETFFLEILRGFLKHAAQTSDSLAVCEFPQATVTENFLARSGLSATAVTRMMPAMAAWIAGGRAPQEFAVGRETLPLIEVMARIVRNAFDPGHRDYWQPAPADRSNQRQVESSIIAWSLWLLRDKLLPRLTREERRHTAEWLESCTQRPVRNNNWAWFTAVNQAARIALSDRYREFRGDAAFMLDDLRALDQMAVGSEGWYNDSPGRGMAFDYYNSWVFASHFLYWNRIIGRRYPDWSMRFGSRLRQYLTHAPHFFGANGGHVLYGRSLIYRFGVLTPLVLAHTQRLWPHSPGLLARIVRGNFDYHMALGGFDAERGKLRESFTPDGTLDIRESYIDGGHPYWGMQAFALFLIPPQDRFWSGAEEPLPVEQAGYRVPLAGPGMVVAGHRDSGHVRLFQARSTRTDPHYRDKYIKFSYSSHFPFAITHDAAVCPWDNTLVLREAARTITRGEIAESRVSDDRVEMRYKLGPAEVRTTILIHDEFEGRFHLVTSAAGSEVLEGSSALGLGAGDRLEESGGRGRRLLRNAANGYAIATWLGRGWESLAAASDFGPPATAASNIVYPRMRVNTLVGRLREPRTVLASVHYSSPQPLDERRMHQEAMRLFKRLEALIPV